jgi:hypothetical protein
MMKRSFVGDQDHGTSITYRFDGSRWGPSDHEARLQPCTTGSDRVPKGCGGQLAAPSKGGGNDSQFTVPG